MELRNPIIFLTFCFFFAALEAAKAKEGSGYIFTSQRVLKQNSKNQLQLLRFGNQDAGRITVSLFVKEDYNSNETLVSKTDFQFQQGKKQTFFKLFVAKLKNENPYSGRLQIDGNIGNEKIKGSDDVSFATPKTSIVVIQTDKHLYKTGDTVNIRVLKLNSQLKASHQKDDVGEIFIEDPKGTRLFQQKGIYLGKGLADTKFMLADEPVLGTWKVTLKTKNETETTTFEVRVYQLPKFEVKIKFPPFTLATTEIVPITVCANFTYGKPVIGTLNLNVSINQYYYYAPSSSSNIYPIDHKKIDLNGCYTYKANITALQKDPQNPNYYSQIKVVANVVQQGTGVQINATELLQRTTTPLSLNFDSVGNQRNYFKPGLPYNGKLKVTNPDNSPASGEKIQLSYTVIKQRVIAGYLGTRQVQYSKNFTADKNGLVRFTIPPQNVDTTSVNIEAQSFKYSGNTVLSNPYSSLYLSPFYSPSGSYVQLANVDDTIACGTKKEFKLLFTSKANTDYLFYYEVLKQGQIVHSGKQKVHFTENDDVSYRFDDDNRLIDDQQKTIVPSPQQQQQSSSSSSSSSEENEDDCPAARESRFLSLVGEAKIKIDVDYSLSDEFSLLVFYVRDDKETVADSHNFQVEKCFKNKVDFKFGDKVKQPGQNTTIKINASPNSLCGVRAIDKSVTLLNNGNQLTKDKIFQLIDAMNVDNYYSEDLCNQENHHQPGLSSKDLIILPPGPDSSSSSDDSYAVFQQSGFLVISNLRLFTRQCNKNNNVRPPGGNIFYAKAAGAGAIPAPDGKAIRIIPAGPVAAAAAGSVSTVSAVSVRTDFPETWLFQMETVGPSGSLTTQTTLPGTITEWLGDAVCVSPGDGLGISDQAHIQGFQLFFIDYTLPNSAVRGEVFTVIVSVSSYANDALAVTVALDDPEGFEVVNSEGFGAICVGPGETQNIPLKLKATKVGNVNITVRAETSKDGKACGTSGPLQYARDAITKPLEIVAEGFPVQAVQSVLFCPLDQNNQAFDETYNLNLPDDAVPDSERAFLDVSGNILGRSIQNLNSLVSLPTGCGEQNLVKFVPNYLVIDYLKAIGELTDDIKDKAIQNLITGYQREQTYRHDDNSYSAFGSIDGDGSMFLTAFVLRSFVEAQRYISIDPSVLSGAQEWIVQRQQPDGCFPDIGQIIDTGLQGGIEKDKSPTTITAYVLASLLVSQYQNQTVLDQSDQCLENNPPKTPYETFLVIYAEAMAGKKDQAQKRLKEVQKYAQIDEDGVETYFNPNGTDTIDLETVAYAVLSNLLLGNDLNSILPLVRDLTAKLQPDGGFYSTQDTVVGLAALSGFAKLVYGKPVNIDIQVSGALNENLQITDGNKLLVQRKQVDQVPGDVAIKATGSGCGIIQLTFRYNSQSPPDENQFYIKVLGQCSGKDCSTRTVSGTVRYAQDDKVTGFSIVTIKMITGMVPDMDTIKKLPGANGNNILRADVDGNNVVLYYNQISSAGENFEFPVNQAIKVDNPQPGSATVTNYYNPAISTTTTYTFDDTKPATATTAAPNSVATKNPSKNQ